MGNGTDDSLATRETLLNRLKDRLDHSSWQQFHDKYRQLIYAFARKAGLTETEADDVVQETLVGMARKLPDFKVDPARCTFRTWLLNQTNWRIKDQIRKRMQESPASAQVRTSGQFGGADETTPVERIPDLSEERWEALWEEDWRRTVISTALRAVTGEANPRDCQIFDFHVLRAMPPKEVARALGVSVARVYLAKHRIAKLVKRQIQLLEKEGI